MPGSAPSLYVLRKDHPHRLELFEEGGIPLLTEGVQHCDRVASLQAFGKHDPHRRDAYASSNEQNTCHSEEQTLAEELQSSLVGDILPGHACWS